MFTYSDSIHLQWKPNWKKAKEKILKDTLKYIYIPLDGQITTKGNKKVKTVETVNTEKYLIIKKTFSKSTFSLATYAITLTDAEKKMASSKSLKKYRNHSIPFKTFTGVLSLRSLSNDQMNFYNYSSGSIEKKVESQKKTESSTTTNSYQICTYYLNCVWLNNFPMYCGNVAYGESQVRYYDVNSVEQCYMPPAGYWDDGLNPCVPDWSFAGSYITQDCMTFPDDPPPPPPGEGGDTGNTGNNGDPGNNNPPADILNNVQDTCLKKVVNSVINNDVKGKIASIIGMLDSNVNVKIFIRDSTTTVNNRPGTTTKTSWSPGINGKTNFQTTITLSQYHLLESSQEFIASVIIHEVLHAYFRKTTGKEQAFKDLDHETMATFYIGPIAEFLHELFGIELIDAYAIAWAGVSDTKAYTESTMLELWKNDDGSSVTHMSKENLSTIATQYVAKIKGKPLCEQ